MEFSLLAEACHAYSEKVEDPAEVEPALKRGLEQVKGGRPAVLDVRIGRP